MELIESLGSELLVHFSIDARRVDEQGTGVGATETTGPDAMVPAGTGVARAEPRTAVKVGQRARFLIDPERLHFFDPDSGDAIR